MDRYQCVTNGFTKTMVYKINQSKNEVVVVLPHDVLEVDRQGYLRKDGIRVCHKESILGHYHFKKISKK